MHEIKAILFDLGNTLSASASLGASLSNLAQSPSINEMKLGGQQLKILGMEVESQINRLNQENPSLQPHWLEVWQSAIYICGLSLTSSECERLCRVHLQQYLSECKVEPYSIPLLSDLQEAKIPLGLVSNVTGPVELFDQDLRRKGLASFFQSIVWSSTVGYRKPDPRIFQSALDQLSLPPGKSIIMVGDNEQADIFGGKNMGFTTVKVVKSEEAATSIADYVVVGSSLQHLFRLQRFQRNFATI